MNRVPGPAAGCKQSSEFRREFSPFPQPLSHSPLFVFVSKQKQAGEWSGSSSFKLSSFPPVLFLFPLPLLQAVSARGNLAEAILSIIIILLPQLVCHLLLTKHFPQSCFSLVFHLPPARRPGVEDASWLAVEVGAAKVPSIL